MPCDGSGVPEGGRALTRIVVVDDEAAHVKALCDVLPEHGYEVSGYASATDALARLRSARHEILMTDLVMPDMDGVTLLREAQRADPDLAGIIMTGQGSIESAVEAMKSGAQDYVLKPLRLRVLLAVLQRTLDVRALRIDNRSLLERLSERSRELEAANAELEAFSYSVSHDLRGPLRAITGFNELLELEYANRLPADARELLHRVGASASRMNALIDDMLRLSQLGRSPLEKHGVDMQALVLRVIEQLPPNVQDPRARVRVGQLPTAHGDVRLLEQVFMNLLSNAFKFAGKNPQPTITIDSVVTNEGAVYFVRDNGVGFPMSNADRLFTPFQRLHHSSEFEGTGVGLSIVQRIVQRHGGRVWAEGELDRGAAFYFTLGPSHATDVH